MNFAFSDEQESFRETLRRFAAERWPVAESRRLADSPRGFEPDVWRALASELGLAGLLVAEEHGGQGASFLELGIVLEELGRQLAGGPLFAAQLCVLALQNCATPAEQAELLPGIARGETLAALALSAGVEFRGGRLHGAQRFVVDAQNASLLLIGARSAEGAGLFAVAADAPGVEITPAAPLDLTRKFAHLRLSGAAARKLGAADATAGCEKTRLQAIVALSAEQIGSAQQCLDMALAYVRGRFQFGRPVGSFQAVKHRAADAHMRIELARSAACWSWWVAANSGAASATAELAEAARVVKSLCSEAHQQAAYECIHLHGGQGFTWEHDAHLHYRRALSNASLFGSPTAHRAALARQLGLRPRLNGYACAEEGAKC
ncbi:MAG: acyl-CoA/acyl-ACP dehydrogenase [Deltaproteobacteria bacterium]|nr:acyl-CoA/acyl-ACP dehydrogenase [Deltaproteobacteria bacterium]